MAENIAAEVDSSNVEQLHAWDGDDGAYWAAHADRFEEGLAGYHDQFLAAAAIEATANVLDIGCGWGATLQRAMERYDVNVVGLTLSKNQQAHVSTLFERVDSPRSRRVLLRGWEEFDEPVDRIVSIGAFEHFGGGNRHLRFEEIVECVGKEQHLL